MFLLEKVQIMLRHAGWSVGNVDAVMVAQRPKISLYREEIIKTIANTMEIPTDAVNVKATTEEGLGFTGEELGIAAHAVCLIYK